MRRARVGLPARDAVTRRRRPGAARGLPRPAAAVPRAACARSGRRRAAPAWGSASAMSWLCRSGVSLSLRADQDLDRDAGQRLELRELVVHPEGRGERGERPHGRGVHDLGPGQHHGVGRVGAVEQVADQLLVPRGRRRQQPAQPLDDAGAGQGRVQRARRELLLELARRASWARARGRWRPSRPGPPRGPGRRRARVAPPRGP